MKPKLSLTQTDLVEKLREHGGRIERWRGGFWTYPGCSKKYHLPLHDCEVPEWYVGVQTVRALTDRGVLVTDDPDAPEWRAARRLRDD